MAGRANKQKGTSYENKLVTFLTKDCGLTAWRVPMSGALGHNPRVKLPAFLKNALKGDVCARIGPDTYLPFEVKYRAGADGFRSLYNDMERNGYHAQSYPDCWVFTETDLQTMTRRDLTEHRLLGQLADRPHITHTRTGLNTTLGDWFVDAEVLALKAQDEPWLFVIRKEPT